MNVQFGLPPVNRPKPSDDGSEPSLPDARDDRMASIHTGLPGFPSQSLAVGL